MADLTFIAFFPPSREKVPLSDNLLYLSGWQDVTYNALYVIPNTPRVASVSVSLSSSTLFRNTFDFTLRYSLSLEENPYASVI